MCELAIALSSLVVTIFKCSINPITNPNPRYSHSITRECIMNWKRNGGSWPNSRCYHCTYLECLCKDTKNISQKSRPPFWDLNPGTYDYYPLRAQCNVNRTASFDWTERTGDIVKSTTGVLLEFSSFSVRYTSIQPSNSRYKYYCRIFSTYRARLNSQHYSDRTCSLKCYCTVIMNRGIRAKMNLTNAIL
jgi:hypothetical protein